MNIEELQRVFAKNIIFYRKEANMTQSQLATKIAYSDKTISKWERGESIPDVYILTQLAEVFHVTVNDLISPNQKRNSNDQNRNRLVISLLSAGIVWVIAALIFVILKLCEIPYMLTFLPFFYGFVGSAVVLLIFNCIWGSKGIRFWIITIIIWSFLSSIFYNMYIFNINEAYVVYFLGIPSQFLDIFFLFLKRKKSDI